MRGWDERWEVVQPWRRCRGSGAAPVHALSSVPHARRHARPGKLCGIYELLEQHIPDLSTELLAAC